MKFGKSQKDKHLRSCYNSTKSQLKLDAYLNAKMEEKKMEELFFALYAKVYDDDKRLPELVTIFKLIYDALCNIDFDRLEYSEHLQALQYYKNVISKLM